MLLLSKACGLPIMAAGDFNDTTASMQDAGWFEILDAVYMDPSNVKSTLNTATNMIVDFLIRSKSIRHLVLSIIVFSWSVFTAFAF